MWEENTQGCEHQKAGLTEGHLGGCLQQGGCCHVAIHVRSKDLSLDLPDLIDHHLRDNKSKAK